jgi:hypothetical protein
LDSLSPEHVHVFFFSMAHFSSEFEQLYSARETEYHSRRLSSNPEQDLEANRGFHSKASLTKFALSMPSVLRGRQSLRLQDILITRENFCPLLASRFQKRKLSGFYALITCQLLTLRVVTLWILERVLLVNISSEIQQERLRKISNIVELMSAYPSWCRSPLWDL